MLSPDHAYTIYLQLEAPRTLEKLRLKLAEDGAEVPTLRWCQKWSARDKWRDRAKEHDRQVELRASEMIVEAKAETRVELSELAEKAAAKGFAALAEILATWRPTKGEDIERMAAITTALANCSSALKQDGLRGALRILEGPLTAAQIAAGGGGVWDLVKDHFLPPPEGA
jgi:hypothetical protein